MAAKWRWKLSAQLADIVSWLRPASVAFKRDEPRIELTELLKKHKRRTLDYAADCASDIGLWESQFGARAVLEGDASGWGHLRLATAWYLWRVRAMFHLYKKAVAQGNSKDISYVHESAVRGLALAMALREDELADWCGRLMVQELSHPTGFFSDWDDTPFYPFMAWLFARWKHLKVDTTKPPFGDLGVYQQVVDSWDNDEALAVALLKACDYHCLRAAPPNGDDPEFWRSPFQVFPGEIIAIQRVRYEQTGSRISIDHPLLASALGSVPVSIPSLVDPLLDDFKGRVILEERSSL